MHIKNAMNGFTLWHILHRHLNTGKYLNQEQLFSVIVAGSYHLVTHDGFSRLMIN